MLLGERSLGLGIKNWIGIRDEMVSMLSVSQIQGGKAGVTAELSGRKGKGKGKGKEKEGKLVHVQVMDRKDSSLNLWVHFD